MHFGQCAVHDFQQRPEFLFIVGGDPFEKVYGQYEIGQWVFNVMRNRVQQDFVIGQQTFLFFQVFNPHRNLNKSHDDPIRFVILNFYVRYDVHLEPAQVRGLYLFLQNLVGGDYVLNVLHNVWKPEIVLYIVNMPAHIAV